MKAYIECDRCGHQLVFNTCDQVNFNKLGWKEIVVTHKSKEYSYTDGNMEDIDTMVLCPMCEKRRRQAEGRKI